MVGAARRGVPLRFAPARAAVTTLVIVALAACQSGGGPPKTARCTLTPGMNTDQLAGCGCVSADTRSDYHVALASEQERNAAQSVSIINYMCPLGAAGIAMVVVINGVANEIFH